MVRFNKIVYCLLLVIIAHRSNAQIIDNTSSFKNSLGNKYFKLHYDNDYFTKTDEYYTQGITLEYANPVIKRFITSKILLQPKNTDITYGFRIDNFGYTPTTLRSDSILYGDRPYCGDMSASTFAIAVDTVRQQIISTTFVIGLMGQGAGGKEFQTTIHKWTGNFLPLGWQYQIRNDIILDYQVNYEKRLLSYRNSFLLNGASSLRVGTHSDKLTGGFNFMAGNFNDRYLSVATTKPIRKKVQYYLYGQLVGGAVGYDATLQGGMFDRTSPYTIPTGNISRFTLQGDYGIVVCFRKLYLEYCQSYLTKEFSTGHYHRWGGIRIGFTI
ncbi:MAG TPA: lipid A deacylase LpxR family protein [Ferruginibacter sp.]|jgi:lipid A 3-O-deacylase|nr:lipid A deacylase LpxR family protein [Ferruginibacter sp.]